MKPSEMDKAAFVAAFGAIFEDSPWVAERAWESGLDARHDVLAGLHGAMTQAVAVAPADLRDALLMAHPRLGTKRPMGRHSASEQRAARLHALSDDESRQLAELNDAYFEKFGFPFIMAARGADKQSILRALRERLENADVTAEKARAFAEINAIARFRLEDRLGGG